MASVDTSADRARTWQLPALRGVPGYLPLVWLGLVVVGAILGATVFAEQSEESSAAILEPPSASHLFGTDELGRDVFVRVLAGATVSLEVSILAVLIGLALGATVGTLAAFSRRFADEVLMRSVDILLAFPAIVLALLVSLLFGTSLVLVALTIGIVITPQMARIVRGRMAIELGEGYVTAERSTGAGRRRILFVHVLRNVAPAVAAFALLLLADSMLFEAALSFIGVGIQPPRASWGNMILEGQQLLVSDAWWVSVFPGIALFLTIASLNVLADRQIGFAEGGIGLAKR
jgi:peptide/nickel transport system permease protein